MPLIGYETSFTLHIGAPTNNEYMKVTLSVKDIDTSLDVAEQIQAAHAGLHQAMAWLDEQTSDKIMQGLNRRVVDADGA